MKYAKITKTEGSDISGMIAKNTPIPKSFLTDSLSNSSVEKIINVYLLRPVMGVSILFYINFIHGTEMTYQKQMHIIRKRRFTKQKNELLKYMVQSIPNF